MTSRPQTWRNPLARNDVRLFLTSLAILFVELMLIRWIPANVKYIGFFSNFLLIASFLGIGLGIILGRNGFHPRLSPFAFLLAVVVALAYRLQLNVQVDSNDEIFFGLAESSAADLNFLILPLVVGLVVALLATLALPLGPLLKSMRPLKAYAIDIAGSMTGIAAFTILAALGTNPMIWFAIGMGVVVALELGRRIRWQTYVNVGALAFVVLLVVSHTRAAPNEIWSPYYRIGSFVDGNGLKHLTVDGIPHQALHPLGQSNLEPIYEQVYEWFPDKTYEEVLIVGAGSGSDVAIALDRGAGHVDAVEIDPRLQQIGIEEHPNQPYADPRVTRYVNDGRAFLRNSDKKYDLVVFALPDSLTLVSQQGGLRLESFLFTEEAFANVRDHMSDDGIFVLYNYYRDDWLVTKLSDMLADSFDHEPLVTTYGIPMATLAAGPLVAGLPDGQPPGGEVTGPPAAVEGQAQPKPATDDWPFLYLFSNFVAPHYLSALAIVLFGALVAVAAAAAATGTSIRRFSPHFFALGVAFLLLTTRSLTSFSLLFGTTWLVNSLAFFGILASVLVAIFVNSRWPIRRPTPFYVALFVAIAVAYFLPPQSLLIDPPILRYGLAAIVAFAPVFLANLVFSYSFRDTATADMSFASNLLGAMVGGALEYLALITGYQALLLVVALFYALAWLFATKFRLGADKELASGRDEEPAPLKASTPLAPEAGVSPMRTAHPALVGGRRIALNGLLLVVAVACGGVSPTSRPVSAQDIDGSMALSFELPRAVWRVEEIIEGRAGLVPVDGEQTPLSWIGTNAFAFEYAHEDSGLTVHPSVATVCAFGTVDGTTPLSSSLRKSGSYDEHDPNAEFFRQFFDDPDVRLFPGTWRITAIVLYYDGVECEGTRRELRASVEIEVIG